MRTVAVHLTDDYTSCGCSSVISSISEIRCVDDQVARDFDATASSGGFQLDVVADVDGRSTQDVVDLGEVVGKLDAGVGVDFKDAREIGVSEWCL